MPTQLDIIAALEEVCPLSLQETWDNSGWQVGNPNLECTGAILAVEATEATVQEALETGCNLLITHHPLLFHPLKHIGSRTYQERTVALAIKHDIAIYSAHTNADNAAKGINYYLAERLQLQNTRALVAQPCNLYKLSVMVPTASAPEVERALCAAGAGRLGCYDSCSFSVEGRGHFRPLEGANPTIGSLGELEEVIETQISLLIEPHLVHKVIQAIYASHPYEEPAYELISLATPHGCHRRTTPSHKRRGVPQKSLSVVWGKARCLFPPPRESDLSRCSMRRKRREFPIQRHRTACRCLPYGRGKIQRLPRCGRPSPLCHHRASRE